mmetsp:Transcript_4552/g.12699  ORF Transcript_4552/g.12699 Transcript_4552/m.12699 type:complete len:524 (-) Transcript_4552:268-1839(-)|eukprot:CAMPEP_0117672788 /NCGR_PEP_ID=MMETSP0804-20121206/14104_1 /TAXON_ID=1074897 /ORGANISM="Tetraselmis astigmatica, Strain CCMP880" /LENGTH=523 /DNA_ID=CAMNT_0005481439 /DNA_START=376 /DNA_END=1947 /DNA_ORIENTATION=+
MVQLYLSVDQSTAICRGEAGRLSWQASSTTATPSQYCPAPHRAQPDQAKPAPVPSPRGCRWGAETDLESPVRHKPRNKKGITNGRSPQEKRALGGVEWLVQATRSSPRYRSDFRFLQRRCSADMESAGSPSDPVADPDGWASAAAPSLSPCDSSTPRRCRMLALYCEFSQAPGGRRVPTRLAAVNEHMELVLDCAIGLADGPSGGRSSSLSAAEGPFSLIQGELLEMMTPSTVLMAHGLHLVLEPLRICHSRLVDTSHLFISDCGSRRPSLDTLSTHLLADDPHTSWLLADQTTAPHVHVAKLTMAVVLRLTALGRLPQIPHLSTQVLLPDSLGEDDCCCKVHQLPQGSTSASVRALFPSGTRIKGISTWSRGGRSSAEVHFWSPGEATAAFEGLECLHMGLDKGGYLFKELLGGCRIRSSERLPRHCSFKVHQLPGTAKDQAQLVAGLFPSSCQADEGMLVMPTTEGRAATVVFRRAADARLAFESLAGNLSTDSGGFPVKKLPGGVKVKWDIPLPAAAAVM